MTVFSSKRCNVTNLSHASKDGIKSAAEMPVRDGREDTNHCRIVKLID